MSIRVRAPGRICLFGEHQDYLGFPIIAAAIDRYIFMESKPNSEPSFHILMQDLQKEMKLPLNSIAELTYESKRDYLRSAYNVLKRRGLKWGDEANKGYEIKLFGNIPINAGASSSSAMIIAWLSLLSYLANKPVSPQEIATLGYQSEVAEFGEAGGMMDHFTSALGGLIYMQTAPEFKPKSISNYQKNFEQSFILIDSMEKKNTVDDLRRVKNNALESFTRISTIFPSFNKYTTQLNEIEPFLTQLPEQYRKVLVGNLSNRDLTQKAFKILEYSEKNILSDKEKRNFGSLIYEHHQHLSQEVGISIPKIDKIVNLCMGFGAYGSKINGSGFGGTLFVYCPKNRDEIINMLKEKNITYYPIEISQGAGLF